MQADFYAKSRQATIIPIMPWWRVLPFLMAYIISHGAFFLFMAFSTCVATVCIYLARPHGIDRLFPARAEEIERGDWKPTNSSDFSLSVLLAFILAFTFEHCIRAQKTRLWKTNPTKINPSLTCLYSISLLALEKWSVDLNIKLVCLRKISQSTVQEDFIPSTLMTF